MVFTQLLIAGKQKKQHTAHYFVLSRFSRFSQDLFCDKMEKRIEDVIP